MAQESLSALMDGECSDQELDAILADFETSAETRQAWSRMCLVRDVLGGAKVANVGSDFCSGVMAAIAADQAADQEAEQAAEVAAAAPPPAVVQPSKVVQLPVAPRRPARGRWQQPLVGLAAAASIAGAVVLGGNSLLSQRPLAATAADTAAAAPSGLTPVASRGVTALAAANDSAETGIDQLDSESARQLNDYVMEHSNYRAEQGMGGSLSYARMAVHNADYHPASGPR